MNTRTIGCAILLACGTLNVSSNEAKAQFGKFKGFKNPIRISKPAVRPLWNNGKKRSYSPSAILRGRRVGVPKKYQINGPAAWGRVRHRRSRNGRLPIFAGHGRKGGFRMESFRPGQRPGFGNRSRQPVQIDVAEPPRRGRGRQKINGQYGPYYSNPREIQERRKRDRQFNNPGRYGNGGGSGNTKSFYLNRNRRPTYRRNYRPVRSRSRGSFLTRGVLR